MGSGFESSLGGIGILPPDQIFRSFPLAARSRTYRPTQDEKAPVCSVMAIPGKGHRLGDSRALLAVIRRVAEQQGCARAGSALRLRITVDATGRITKAERLAGDEVLAAVITGKLTGQSSATKAKSAPEGTLEVTIKF
jgi:hypothetical protein